jgi:hypothetical protein
MGRGRAKAKQTKVARALKYYSPSTDLSALEHELHGSSDRFTPPSTQRDAEPEPDDYDEYGKWASGGR